MCMIKSQWNSKDLNIFKRISVDSNGFQWATDGCTMLHPKKTTKRQRPWPGAVRFSCSAWRQQSLGAVQAILPCQVGGFGRLTRRSYGSYESYRNLMKSYHLCRIWLCVCGVCGVCGVTSVCVCHFLASSKVVMWSCVIPPGICSVSGTSTELLRSIVTLHALLKVRSQRS